MCAEAFMQRMISVDGQDVPCRFFKPQADRGDFCCRYEVAWPEGTQSRTIYGVDEVQAMLLAMQSAHTDFLVAREDEGRNISWLGDRRLGLPVADVIRDLDAD